MEDSIDLGADRSAKTSGSDKWMMHYFRYSPFQQQTPRITRADLAPLTPFRRNASPSADTFDWFRLAGRQSKRKNKKSTYGRWDA